MRHPGEPSRSRAASAFGPIDVLVNNAGIGSSADPRPLAEFRDAFWDETLELNLTAPYLLSKAALPHMREQGWGRIVTVAWHEAALPSVRGARSCWRPGSIAMAS